MTTLDQAKQLQSRTKKFAVRIINAFAGLQKTEAARVIALGNVSGGELSRRMPSAFGCGFHFEDQLVTEEADETHFWFELLVESKLIKMKLVKPLTSECDELLKIFSASLTTAKTNRKSLIR